MGSICPMAHTHLDHTEQRTAKEQGLALSTAAALKRAGLKVRGQIFWGKMGITPTAVLAVASTMQYHLKQLSNRNI